MNPGGNERLTAAVGPLVLALVLVEAATLVLGVHTFMSLHVFVGLALIPAVVLKLATTGWRFARYYTRSRAYIAQGPPQSAMRLLAPLFVSATAVPLRQRASQWDSSTNAARATRGRPGCGQEYVSS